MKLAVKDISKSFGDHKVLENVSLEVKKGQIVAVVGASGVGKTTLFNIIAGTLLPEEGTATLNGVSLLGAPGKVGYMPQKDLLLPHKTILDNVALPLLLRGEKPAAAREKARSYFDSFGLKGTEKKYPDRLSGGMRQRAAFLRTYLFSSEVTLLDEPFSALDAITKSQMHQWYLDMVAKLDLSALFITHDIDEAIFLADKVYVLAGRPGRIAAELEIELLRPRLREVTVSELFFLYKKKIMDILG